MIVDDDGIVGEIAPSGLAKPLWRVVRHDFELHDAPANTRPCAHPHFTIDAKFHTVTCDACNERVDPFAVLMTVVESWGKIENHRLSAIEAEKRLHRAELKRLRSLKLCTPEQASAIDEMFAWPSRSSVREMQALVTKIHEAHHKARAEKRQAKRGSRQCIQ